MSTKVIENVGVGTELAKRTYLDGVLIEKVCDCGNVIQVDLESDYLTYPTVGRFQNIYVYCDECGTEYPEGTLKVKIVLNLEVESADEQG